MTKYAVVYRPHGALNIHTRIYGAFDSYDAAEDFLCELPALGAWPPSEPIGHGVKYITELVKPKGVPHAA